MDSKEFLDSLKLEEGAAKKAKAGLDKLLSGYVLKTELDAAKTAKTTLEKQLGERNAELEELKKTSGDKAAFEAKYKELKTKYIADKQQYEDTMKDMKINNAIKLKLISTAQDVDIVAGLIDKNKILVSDGSIAGLDEQIKTLKASKPFLFKEEGKSPQYKPNGGTGGNDKNPFKKETLNMTEAGRLLRENPAQAKALAAAAGFNLGGIE